MNRFNEMWELDAAGCHIWKAAKGGSGYGEFSLGSYYQDGKRKTPYAHRWLFQQVHGWSDEQMPPCVCHSCDIPACVNEWHLFPGTHKDNMDDMATKGRTPDRRGKKGPNARLTEEEVLSVYFSICKASEIAELYGITVDHVYGIRRGRSWKHLTGGLPQIERKHRNVKLTEQEVLSIYASRLTRTTNDELARQYGVDSSEISRIRSGKTWKRLTAEVPTKGKP